VVHGPGSRQELRSSTVWAHPDPHSGPGHGPRFVGHHGVGRRVPSWSPGRRGPGGAPRALCGAGPQSSRINNPRALGPRIHKGPLRAHLAAVLPPSRILREVGRAPAESTHPALRQCTQGGLATLQGHAGLNATTKLGRRPPRTLVRGRLLSLVNSPLDVRIVRRAKALW
jgi:hypothetical protein